MHFSIRLKHAFFDHYWWLMILAAIAALFLLVHLKESPASYIGAAGAILSVVYFIQKQRLEEARLFREIFKECNQRYDAMNEQLASICDSDEPRLSPNEARLLIDYFNLCGEEYLYFRQGYIPTKVWEAWFSGMKIVICSPRVNELWRIEAATDSYYGLPLKPFNAVEKTS